MGRTLVRLIHERGEDQVVGAIARPGVPEQGRDVGELAGAGHIGVAVTADHALALLGAEVVIDFSTPSAVLQLCRAVQRSRVPLVSGTTGIGEEGQLALRKAAEAAPLLWAPNMSLGVELLARLTEQATAMLGDDYDIQIVEAHHRRKVDAPSGTALRLAEGVLKARDVVPPGPQVSMGPSNRGALGMHSLRSGNIVGDHTIHFLGPCERIEMTHRTTERDLFARGALRAARWLIGRKPGRYVLGDLFG